MMQATSGDIPFAADVSRSIGCSIARGECRTIYKSDDRRMSIVVPVCRNGFSWLLFKFSTSRRGTICHAMHHRSQTLGRERLWNVVRNSRSYGNPMAMTIFSCKSIDLSLTWHDENNAACQNLGTNNLCTIPIRTVALARSHPDQSFTHSLKYVPPIRANRLRSPLWSDGRAPVCQILGAKLTKAKKANMKKIPMHTS